MVRLLFPAGVAVLALCVAEILRREVNRAAEDWCERRLASAERIKTCQARKATRADYDLLTADPPWYVRLHDWWS